MDIISNALEMGLGSLSEYTSKQFLSSFGIPITAEAYASDPRSASEKASRIGFPVALKVSGHNLTHKTEIGGICLNLKTEDEVISAGQELLTIEGSDGLLVQEMVKGQREIACGLIRDKHFGPCVMFGLGGTLIEIIDDITFRVSPLSETDALEMLEEIQYSKILKPFRGEKAANTDALTQILMILGNIGLQYNEILEIDINPLKIQPDGTPIAVDASIILRSAYKE